MFYNKNIYKKKQTDFCEKFVLFFKICYFYFYNICLGIGQLLIDKFTKSIYYDHISVPNFNSIFHVNINKLAIFKFLRFN